MYPSLNVGWPSQDDMEGSGGVFLNRQPGVRGPEGKQVCFIYLGKTPLQRFNFILNITENKKKTVHFQGPPGLPGLPVSN